MGSYSQLPGSRWMHVTATGNHVPTNGAGGVSTTASASELASSTACAVESITVLTAHSSATVITVRDSAGNALAGCAYPIAANQACPFYIPIGGENGRQLNLAAGFSVSTDHASTTFALDYRRVE